MPKALSRLGARAYANPWLLLSITCLSWAGNVVAARLAIGEISPMTLVAGRWTLCCAVLAAFARRDFFRDLPMLRSHWRKLALMGFFGFTAFNVLYYVSAHFTSGLHIAILQGVAPVAVFVGAWALWRTPVAPWQALGCVLTLLGAALVGARGDLTQLLRERLDIGDIGLIVASVFYGCYALALRSRPVVSPFGFFAALAIAALATSLPLLAVEVALGDTFRPTWTGLAILLYVTVFPTFVAQMFFIRGVELIGPGRATLFYNLTPAIGAVASTSLLGERFEPYHAVALALVVGGVLMAEKLGSKPK